MNETIIASIIGIIGSAITTTIVGIAAYLAKDKIESFNQRLDELEEKIDQTEQKRKDEHDVVLMWISRISKQLDDEGMDVTRPERLKDSLEVEDGGD